MTGIGGQGVQLIGKTLALGATLAGRHAMLAAEYGGEMRGGPSQATVVIGSAPLAALPVLPDAGSAVLLHDRFAMPVLERLRPDSLVMINSSVVAHSQELAVHRVVEVAATDLAREAGRPQTAGLIMLGAFNRLTDAVGPEFLIEAMRSLLPPYRAQYAEDNAEALVQGAALIDTEVAA